IDISNLQRQLFFDECAVGKSKAGELKKKMSLLNSDVDIISYEEMINRKNFNDILSGYDIIVDATDNPATKYFIDEAAGSIKTPCCLGGVSGWRGQVVIFSNSEDGSRLRYADIFPEPKEQSAMLPCEIEGVMGPAAATVASIQASEILQYLLNKENGCWQERMIVLDLSIPSMNVIELC
ncbi:MAG: ThiF family adenylyltransferase, partial [Muribaculaceae bacterium]|nr:ThiF family adenylyltransferase [Muribaculaceae bacterium]